MKSDADYRLATQINGLSTSIGSEWEDSVLFDEDDPDFAAAANCISGVNGSASAVLTGNLAVLRPASQATAVAACVLNSLMLKGECIASPLDLITTTR